MKCWWFTSFHGNERWRNANDSTKDVKDAERPATSVPYSWNTNKVFSGDFERETCLFIAWEGCLLVDEPHGDGHRRYLYHLTDKKVEVHVSVQVGSVVREAVVDESVERPATHSNIRKHLTGSWGAKCRIPEQTGADADATQVGRSKAVDDRVRSILDVITLFGRITVRHCRLLIKHWLNNKTALFYIKPIHFIVQQRTINLHLGWVNVVLEDVFRYFSIIEPCRPSHNRFRFLNTSLWQQPWQRLGDGPG